MYQLPGFYQLPLGPLLIEKCVNIINLGGPSTWGKVVTESLRGDENLGRDTVRVVEETEDVLYAMKGAGPFANTAGNTGFTDLLYVLQYALNAFGAPVDIPAIVGYRETPEIDFETSIDYAFGDFVKKPATNLYSISYRKFGSKFGFKKTIQTIGHQYTNSLSNTRFI
jgi:hypothetical protein